MEMSGRVWTRIAVLNHSERSNGRLPRQVTRDRCHYLCAGIVGSSGRPIEFGPNR